MLSYFRSILLFVFFSLTWTITAQFIPPLKGTFSLSGTFGEPRTAHFHAGIDFKPVKGYPYDTIIAVADGYISRVNVLGDGYGNALMINHGEYSTVYAHLSHFMPWIQDYIDSTMMGEKRYELIKEPPIDRLPIKQGQAIGILGNTGRSSGAHLHFEVRRTSDQRSLNPFVFGIKPIDQIAPVIGGIVLYKMAADGREITSNYVPVTMQRDGSYSITPSALIESESLFVGVGVHCYDTMNGAKNHNGIYGLKMKINGEHKFAFSMNEIDFETSRYIHAHMDYAAKMENRYVIKCFKNKGSALEIYETDKQLGLIDLYEHLSKKIEISVSDFEGNTSVVRFEIRRQKGLNIDHTIISKPMIYPHDAALLHCGNFAISFPGNSVYQPSHIHCTSDQNSFDLSSNGEIPLFKSVQVTTNLRTSSANRAKIAFCQSKGDKLTRLYHEWSNDTTLVGWIREMSQFSVVLDTIAPEVELVQQPGRGIRLKYKITDNLEPGDAKSGLQYRLSIDGEWVLCRLDHKTHTLWYDIKTPRKNKKYDALLTVKDASGNETNSRQSFVY